MRSKELIVRFPIVAGIISRLTLSIDLYDVVGWLSACFVVQIPAPRRSKQIEAIRTLIAGRKSGQVPPRPHHNIHQVGPKTGPHRPLAATMSVRPFWPGFTSHIRPGHRLRSQVEASGRGSPLGFGLLISKFEATSSRTERSMVPVLARGPFSLACQPLTMFTAALTV